MARIEIHTCDRTEHENRQAVAEYLIVTGDGAEMEVCEMHLPSTVVAAMVGAGEQALEVSRINADPKAHHKLTRRSTNLGTKHTRVTSPPPEEACSLCDFGEFASLNSYISHYSRKHPKEYKVWRDATPRSAELTHREKTDRAARNKALIAAKETDNG